MSEETQAVIAALNRLAHSPHEDLGQVDADYATVLSALRAASEREPVGWECGDQHCGALNRLDSVVGGRRCWCCDGWRGHDAVLLYADAPAPSSEEIEREAIRVHGDPSSEPEKCSCRACRSGAPCMEALLRTGSRRVAGTSSEEETR